MRAWAFGTKNGKTRVGQVIRQTPTSAVAERENSTSPTGYVATSHFDVALEPANRTVEAIM
jgi:hypothetical protein